MQKKIVLDGTEYEIKIAYLINDILEELFVSNIFQKDTIGNIYKGKVTDIINDGKIIFVDIGEDKNAFLSFEHKKNIKFNINDYIIVQVTAPPRLNKGARVTLDYSLNSDNLVLLPYSKNDISISKKIRDISEIKRLKDMFKLSEEGLILRTSSSGLPEEILKDEYKKLKDINNKIIENYHKKKLGLLYNTNDIIDKVIKEIFNEDIDEFIISNTELYDLIKIKLSEENKSNLIKKIKKYFKEENIFKFYNISQQINRALEKKVYLRSGGYIVIERTEAFISIDINTGGNKENSLEKTIFQTNLEATFEIARQIKLRNLSGIIVIDFINMKNIDYKREVQRKLKENLSRDRAQIKVYDFNELGLIHLTRENHGKNLSEFYLENLNGFDEKTKIISDERTILNLLEELDEILKNKKYKNIKIKISKDKIKILNKNFGKELNHIEIIENEEKYKDGYKIELYE